MFKKGELFYLGFSWFSPGPEWISYPSVDCGGASVF